MRNRRIPIYLSLWTFPALVLVLALGVASLHADARSRHRKEARKEIERLESECRTAVIDNDVAALNRLTADDYIGISPNGTLQTKQQLIAALSAGKLRFTKIEYSDTKIRVYGDSAVVTTTAEVTGSNDAGEFSGKYRYTRVYTRHNDTGTWRIVSFESSRVRPEHEH